MSLLSRIQEAQGTAPSHPGGRTVLGGGQDRTEAQSPVHQERETGPSGALGGVGSEAPIPAWRRRQMEEFAKHGRVIDKVFYGG